MGPLNIYRYNSKGNKGDKINYFYFKTLREKKGRQVEEEEQSTTIKNKSIRKMADLDLTLLIISFNKKI